MKNLMIILSIVALFTVTSCTKTESKNATSSYDGKWSLVSYKANSIDPVNPIINYNLGEIVWDFDASANLVVVSVSVMTNPSTNPLNTGNYNYQLGSHSCNYGGNQYITVNNETEGVLVLDNISNNKLTISSECLDGAVLKFER